MKWTEINAGLLHTAEQRFRASMGDMAEKIVGSINDDDIVGALNMILSAIDFKITTIPFDPVFIGNNWKNEDEDKKPTKPTEVDIAKVGLFTSLKEGDPSIKGEEHLRRLKEAGHKPYGANLFMALWKDWEAKKETCLLEKAYQAGIIGGYIDFPDDIFLDPVDGRRYVLYLYRSVGGGWDWGVDWLESAWYARHASVVAPQVSS